VRTISEAKEMLNFGTAADLQWISSRRVVEFSVYDYDSGEPIVCRVSKECITANCGSPQSPEACLDAAKQHFNQITDKVGHLIWAGRFEEAEPSKVILLKESDW
jgi:hypothetical protein